jgi:hypothetical protein
MNMLLNILAVLIGSWIVIVTFVSAVRTFVLPRGDNVWLTRILSLQIAKTFKFLGKVIRDESRQEAMWAYFSPLVLMLLPVVWLTLTTLGFAAIYWGIGVRPWADAFLLSGSSLLTLGYAPVKTTLQMLLSYLDATIGLMLIALLIAYLPTMYAAFSRREVNVAKLQTYAGSPPSSVELLTRVHRIGGETYLQALWENWETWFAEVEESHTSFAPLSFFRSPKPERSWVTASGAIMDAAALRLAAIDLPFEPRAALCIRAGYLAFQSLADFFGMEYDPNPDPSDPISITRDEFEQALDELDDVGLPLKTDRDQVWRDFAGWRVNYDKVLLGIAALTRAPYAPWSSDRAEYLPIRRGRKQRV